MATTHANVKDTKKFLHYPVAETKHYSHKESFRENFVSRNTTLQSLEKNTHSTVLHRKNTRVPEGRGKGMLIPAGQQQGISGNLLLLSKVQERGQLAQP